MKTDIASKNAVIKISHSKHEKVKSKLEEVMSTLENMNKYKTELHSELERKEKKL